MAPLGKFKHGCEAFTAVLTGDPTVVSQFHAHLAGETNYLPMFVTNPNFIVDQTTTR